MNTLSNFNLLQIGGYNRGGLQMFTEILYDDNVHLLSSFQPHIYKDFTIGYITLIKCKDILFCNILQFFSRMNKIF